MKIEHLSPEEAIALRKWAVQWGYCIVSDAEEWRAAPDVDAVLAHARVLERYILTGERVDAPAARMASAS